MMGCESVHEDDRVLVYIFRLWHFKEESRSGLTMEKEEADDIERKAY